MRYSSCIALVLLLFGTSLSAQVYSFRDFFDNADTFLKTYVADGKVDYAEIKANGLEDLGKMVSLIEGMPLEGSDDGVRKAYLINAYNLLVINKVVGSYPIEAPNDIPGFFDKKTEMVDNKSMSLNEFEKELLFEVYGDSRLHFVLVCAAVSCPPIIDVAYRPEILDTQLEEQTRLALNNPMFIRRGGGKVLLSKIFEWYQDDFGGSKESALAYVNEYRASPLSATQISFYPYNWKLNDVPPVITSPTQGFDVSSNNAARYVVSAAIPRGTFEIKGFTNLYSQVTGAEDAERKRDNFFTQNLSVLYGVNDRFNAGIDLRYRQVSFTPESESRLSVFNLEQTDTTRQALTGIGPKIRYAPNLDWPNFSIQSTYWFATANDLQGGMGMPFIDWNGDIWFTQFFNDFSLGDNFSLFTELDVWWEDIGRKSDGHINRVSTPVQMIVSYFPNPQTTIYTLGSYSPFWQKDYDYFYQAGLGAKYQITPKWELELLYTAFRSEFVRQTNGSASTINAGLRISVW